MKKFNLTWFNQYLICNVDKSQCLAFGLQTFYFLIEAKK